MSSMHCLSVFDQINYWFQFEKSEICCVLSNANYSAIDNALKYLQWSSKGGMALIASLPLGEDFPQLSIMYLILRILTMLDWRVNEFWREVRLMWEPGMNKYLSSEEFLPLPKAIFQRLVKEHIHHLRGRWTHLLLSIWGMCYSMPN